MDQHSLRFLRLTGVSVICLGMLVLVLKTLGLTYPGFTVSIYVLTFTYISWYDYTHREIPNAISYPSIFLAYLGGAVMMENGFLASLIGASIGFILFFSIWVVPRLTLGAGDVKLSIAIGAFCGFPNAVLAFCISFAFLIPVVISALIFQSIRGNFPLPMAPFLSAGGFVGLLWGDDIVLWYTGLLDQT